MTSYILQCVQLTHVTDTVCWIVHTLVYNECSIQWCMGYIVYRKKREELLYLKTHLNTF